MSDAGSSFSFKRLLVGRPIPSSHAHHERFSRVTGLAVLSSDPLSSVAYATEEILRVLLLAGAAYLSLSAPIAIVIATILTIVAISYRQTIHAYPSGGGAYIVAKENLGELPGLIAAAALLIDYVLTVAVSIAAGVAALTSALPSWHVNRVELGLGFVAILMLGNLRGIRESGRIFALPTYLFIAGILGLLTVGAWQALTGTVAPVSVGDPIAAGRETLSLFLLLTAFSNGCTAMTGVEAVSNGVPAFRPPEAKNAAGTMGAMAVLSVTMFIGITLLARVYQVVPSESETVLSELARGVFGGRGALYYFVQAGTMAILVLAANTAYADFPRLASILSRDGFLPRQLSNQGDRLAFSNGIIGLSVFAGVLLAVFGGDTHALIPLYMIGVFVSFTLSQAGMVIRWRRIRDAHWRRNAWINGVGAVVTGVVLMVVAVTKAHEGAWIILLLIPMHVWFFRRCRSHYQQVADQLSIVRGGLPAGPSSNTVLVLISGVHRSAINALNYARVLSDDVRAVHVSVDEARAAVVRREWDQYENNIMLVTLISPYRSLREPLDDYIDKILAEDPNGYVTVVLPEFVPARWWHHIFHNQSALLLKASLL
ncbi:MAG: APC family permease, partial [Acidobacteria bacterium]